MMQNSDQLSSFVSTLMKYQQLFLFIGIGIVLWAAIGLQLFAHDTPCPRCWEVRGMYLLILEISLISLLFGYREPLSILMIALFILLGNDITVHQIVQHTINLSKDAAFHAGYGAYALFLGVGLPIWNLILANLAILYLCSLNYFRHRFHITQWASSCAFSRTLVVLWGLAPLAMNAYLFNQHLHNPVTFQ